MSLNALFCRDNKEPEEIARGNALVRVGHGPEGKYAAKIPFSHDECYDGEAFEAEVAAYQRMQQLSSTVPKFWGWAQVHFYPGFISMLVFEYVEGRLLSEIPTEELTPELLCKVKDAYMRVHACEVVQGDPRLENVLVRGDGGVCVIDFGHAVLDPSEQQREMELAEVDDMWVRAVNESARELTAA